VTFFALAAYLAVEGLRDLIGQSRPENSVPGLVVSAAALIVMPGLALAKHRTGRALGNQALIADAAESAFCAFTSARPCSASASTHWPAGGRPIPPPRW
jgi:divalent metal cation (Fe/Co/Zn/Cd) transporter